MGLAPLRGSWGRGRDPRPKGGNRGHGFEPWSGKIPHAVEQLGP